MKPSTLCFWLTLAIGSLTVSAFPQGNTFRSDDPLAVDPDELPIPQPHPVELSQTLDILENTFSLRPDKDVPIPEAENTNTLGEVPDSSWFTNRMGQRVMTIEELVRGPNQTEGPDTSEPWVIIAVKSEGITPGFTIRAGKDEVYFIKFDPPRYPQLATSTEVIATKFFMPLAITLRKTTSASSGARISGSLLTPGWRTKKEKKDRFGSQTLTTSSDGPTRSPMAPPL